MDQDRSVNLAVTSTGAGNTSPVAKCPVCQAGVFGRPLAEVDGYTVHQCPSCYLRFSNPMRHPGAEWYRQSAHYKTIINKSLRLPLWVLYGDWRFKTFLTLGLRRGGRLLDVGCGSGQFLRLAKANGYQVSGIDVDNEAVNVAKYRFSLRDVYVLAAEELGSLSWEEHFDVICMFDVLEHLENPVSALCELGRLLTPGGCLVCTVPGLERWPRIYDSYLDYPPHHLTLWTASSLEKCMSAANLEKVTIARSPVVGGDLWPYVFWRWGLTRMGLLSTLLMALAHFVVAPPVTKAISLVPKVGGFTLLGAAVKRSRG